MKRLLILFFLATALYTHAQPGYTPGIIITNNGDSIKGDLDYREWTKNPSAIDFRTTTGTVQKFEPENIKGFIVLKTGEHYESFSVDVDMALSNSNTVFDSKLNKPEVEHKRLFLLHLVTDSLLSLYIYTDNNKPHLYLSSPNGNPTELINQYLYVPEENALRENRAYRDQLQTVLADCPDIASKAKTLPYLENPIRRLVVSYLKCANPQKFRDDKNERRLIVKFGVILAAMHNSYKFTGQETKSLVSGEYKQNITPVIGVVADIGFKVNNNKWFIVNEIIYKQYQTSHSYFTHTILYDYTTSLDFSFPYLQLNTMLRYRFPSRGSIKPFINSGMGNGYMFAKGKNDIVIDYTDNKPTKKGDAIDGIDRYERSIIFGAGLDIRKLQIEARYAIGSGFSPYVNTKSHVYSPQLLLAYRF